MKSVGLLRVEAKSPIVIVSKKGKGGFLETTEHIPGSTILGGVARRIIIDNFSKGFGNCKDLKGPNDLLKCAQCDAKDKCVYYAIWHRKELMLSYCLPLEQKSLSDPPPIPTLETLFKSREGDQLVDGLLLMSIHKLSLRKEAREEALLEKIETRAGPCKKHSASVHVQKGEIKELEVRLTDSPHVAISHHFKAAEKRYLYSYTMIARGTKFTATAIGEEQLLNTLNNQTISIGTGKSRGNGIVELKIEPQPLETYIDERAKSIKKGFEKITEKINSQLKTPKEDLYGTITGLSPIPLTAGEKPDTVVSRRINPDKLIHLSYKRGTHIRYEFNGGENMGPTFVLTPVINPGYAGVFSLKGDPEQVSRNLAELETRLDGYEPWFGWVTINHPIHYTQQFGGE
ncbi:MAG: hypothetical protein ACTSP1_11080 [Candidatus Freyarchaeota archaeon]